MEKIVADFLRHAGLPVSKSYVSKLIRSHPDYPSILSIADAFEQLGISYQVSRTENSEINRLESPFLIHLNRNKGEVAEIRHKKDLTEAIRADWSGIVVQVASKTQVPDLENSSEFKKERRRLTGSIVILVAVTCVLLTSAWPGFALHGVVLAGLSVIGLALGILLTFKDFGAGSALLSALCGRGKVTDCNDVLKSKGASIKGIKLSGVTVVFFAWSLANVGLFFSDHFAYGIAMLWVSALLSLPMVLYSVHYQAFKIKSWCRICMMVNLILLCQAVILSFSVDLSVILTSSFFLDALKSFFVLAIASGSFYLIQSLISEISVLRQNVVEDLRIINSVDAFRSLLFKQKRIRAESFNYELTVGSPHASMTIMVACNLYCNPCKEKHMKLMNMLQGNEENVRVVFRFALSGNDEGREISSNQYLIQFWLLNIHGRDDESVRTRDLLHDWFSAMNLVRFQRSHPLPIGTDFSQAKLIESKHIEWFDQVYIEFTPTFFLNWYQIPTVYTLDHLKILLPALISEDMIQTELSESFVKS